MTETDDQLLKRYIHAGDRAAIDELIRRHVDLVYAAARRQLYGNEHAADDVTQAVFMLLLSKARSVPRGCTAGWLLQTTRYAAANARRVLARRLHHEHQAAAQRLEAIVSPMEQPLLSNLDKSIASLRSTEREVVVLRYLEGREMTDVCHLLGVSEAAARKRLTRALQRLRQLLSEKGSTAFAEFTVVALLQHAASEKAPASIKINAGPIATQIFKETAMQLLWIKIRFVSITAVLGAAVLTAVGEISHRAYADKPATQPVENIAPASTQPINWMADMHRDQMNLVDIGRAINLYTVVQGGRLPDSLGQTLPFIRSDMTKDSQPKATPIQKAGLYLSGPDLRKKPIPDNPTPKWIDENTSYVYLIPPGMKMTDIPAKDWSMTAIAHLRLDAGYPTVRPDKVHDTIIVVLYLDGRVESEVHGFAEQMIDDSKKHLTPGGTGL
jgi:RNA polymerase sigma factor (sigma-70 family)